MKSFYFSDSSIACNYFSFFHSRFYKNERSFVELRNQSQPERMQNWGRDGVKVVKLYTSVNNL